MSSSYGLKPKFDVKEDPIFSNIKLIASKAKEYGKIACIHNGTTSYAKEMIIFSQKNETSNTFLFGVFLIVYARNAICFH